MECELFGKSCINCVSNSCDYYASDNTTLCVDSGVVPDGTFNMIVPAGGQAYCPPVPITTVAPNIENEASGIATAVFITTIILTLAYIGISFRHTLWVQLRRFWIYHHGVRRNTDSNPLEEVDLGGSHDGVYASSLSLLRPQLPQPPELDPVLRTSRSPLFRPNLSYLN